MTETTDTLPPAPDPLARVLRIILAVILGAAVLAGGAYAYMYASTPEGLRRPGPAHYHFRLQIITDGKPVDFTQESFQTPFNKDICNADLTKEPIHFHDKLDQYVHIHWTGVTGGLLLKNYGWNLVGGANGTLGYRFDDMPRVKRVPVHGAALPEVGTGSNYYVYTGDADGYQKRDWNEFIGSELKDFFSGQKEAGWFERLVPAAHAHGTEAHAAGEEELAQLNEVVGNIVIFVQPNEPTEAQIKDRFNRLIPLPESSCAG